MRTTIKFSILFITLGIFMSSCEISENTDPEQNKIYLDSNGVTIKCEDCNVGDKGIFNGVEYEVVDNQLLRQRRDEGADMTKLCTSLVTDLKEFFLLRIGNDQFELNEFNQPIGNWDVSNVLDMNAMFTFTQFNQPVGDWDVSSVTDMRGMFWQTPFNHPTGDWDVSSVTNMMGIFFITPFNHPIGDWDVGNVTDMESMFFESDFNQPIGDWDVSSVTNMEAMFYDSNFNQNISKWCVTNITSEPLEFSIYAPMIEANKPKWGTCPD